VDYRITFMLQNSLHFTVRSLIA